MSGRCFPERRAEGGRHPHRDGGVASAAGSLMARSLPRAVWVAGLAGGSAMSGKFSSRGVSRARISARVEDRLIGSTIRRPSSREIITSSTASSNSRGMRTAWLRPLRNRRAWRTGIGAFGSSRGIGVGDTRAVAQGATIVFLPSRASIRGPAAGCSSSTSSSPGGSIDSRVINDLNIITPYRPTATEDRGASSFAG